MAARKKRSSNIASYIFRFFTKPGAIFLLAVPVILMEIFVGQYRDSIGIQSFGGWSLLTYLVFFVTGYFLSLDPGFKVTVQEHRVPALLIAAGITLLGIVSYFYSMGSVDNYGDILTAIASWCWLLAIFGFGCRYLSFTSPVLKYANEAVLPFYILHHAVIVIFGFWIAQWDLGVLAKFLLIFSFSLVTIMILYEYLVKRVKYCASFSA